jgi:hypothetical protein
VKNGFDLSRGSIPYFGISILYIGRKRDRRVLYDNSEVAGDYLCDNCDYQLHLWSSLILFYRGANRDFLIIGDVQRGSRSGIVNKIFHISRGYY